jgi:hypothetical protein
MIKRFELEVNSSSSDQNGNITAGFVYYLKGGVVNRVDLREMQPRMQVHFCASYNSSSYEYISFAGSFFTLLNSQ